MTLTGMASVLLTLALSAQLEVVEAEQIAIDQFNVPELGFTCLADGLPTVWIEHQGPEGYLSFSQHDSADTAAFTLRNSVQSVVYDSDGANRRWAIVAEGPASNTMNLDEAAQGRIELVLNIAETGAMTVDFDVTIGTLSRSEDTCSRAPSRPPSREAGQ